MEFDTTGDAMAELTTIMDLYAGGDLEASLAQLGQVAGRIDRIMSAGEIIEQTVDEFERVVRGLADRYLAAP
jgi:enoyl-[acyl-carrier protein] reductase II